MPSAGTAGWSTTRGRAVGTAGEDARSADGELLALLAAGGDLRSFLSDLVHLAARQVQHAEACGLTLTRDGGGVTVASTGPLAERADEGQYEVDTGPCLESMRTGSVVRVDDMATEERWAPTPRGPRSSASARRCRCRCRWWSRGAAAAR